MGNSSDLEVRWELRSTIGMWYGQAGLLGAWDTWTGGVVLVISLFGWDGMGWGTHWSKGSLCAQLRRLWIAVAVRLM
jgi:hypothetical protein